MATEGHAKRQFHRITCTFLTPPSPPHPNTNTFLEHDPAMSIPAPAPPPPIPDPKLDPTTLSSQLPQAQVENLRYKIIQIMEGINGLLITLNTPGMQLAACLLLSKTHTLASSLSTPPTRKGMIGFRQIVPTPFAVNGPPETTASTGQTNPAPNPGAPSSSDGPTGLDPQLDAMLEALLDGRRSISVTKTDVGNVARLHLPGGNAGGVGLGLGIGGMGAGAGAGLVGETVPPDVMLARLEEVRSAHDARCARGVEAVRQLKDKYDWKSRLLFDDSESESSIAVASHHSSEERNSVMDDEEMVEVAPPDEEIVQIEEEGDTPTQPREFVPVSDDSDSDDEEEVQVGLNVGEGAGAGGGGEDGSDSDGMEDVSIQPPPNPMYQNGPQQQQQQQQQPPQQAQSPVTLLDNLFVIDQ